MYSKKFPKKNHNAQKKAMLSILSIRRVNSDGYWIKFLIFYILKIGSF